MMYSAHSRAGSVRMCSKTCRRRGITLVEVTVSTALVGLIIVGALRCLAASTQSGHSAANTTLAVLMAEELMEEILQQDYADPNDTAVFGPEATERDTIRADWDDVDDYHGWKASPPQTADGTKIADAGWLRSVVIQQVSRKDPGDVRSESEDTGVKRITVSVFRDGVLLSRLVSVQTTAWISMIPEYGQASTTGQLPPVNEAPAAQIDSHTSSGTGTVTVSFNAGHSSDPESEPLEFEWDFGDGSSSSDEAPTHSFHNSTTETVVFTVTLVVKDLHGGKDSATSTVTVYSNR